MARKLFAIRHSLFAVPGWTPWILVVAGHVALSGSALAADCASQAAELVRDQAELPRLDAVSPRDRPPFCITLETIMSFAGRVKAHVSLCPGSDFIRSAGEWDQRRADYAKLFSQHRCRRTL